MNAITGFDYLDFCAVSSNLVDIGTADASRGLELPLLLESNLATSISRELFWIFLDSRFSIFLIP